MDNFIGKDGFFWWMGVIEDNVRRSRLFKEREQQLFEIIKKLWNTHHDKGGDKKFSEDAKLEITYKIPEYSSSTSTCISKH